MNQMTNPLNHTIATNYICTKIGPHNNVILQTQFNMLTGYGCRSHLFIRAGEVEELDQTGVITRGQCAACVGQVGTVHVTFVCIPGPDPHYLLSQHTEKLFQIINISCCLITIYNLPLYTLIP